MMIQQDGKKDSFNTVIKSSQSKFFNNSSPPGMQVVKDIALVKKNKGKELKGQASITKLQDFQFDNVLQSYCKNP